MLRDLKAKNRSPRKYEVSWHRSFKLGVLKNIEFRDLKA